MCGHEWSSARPGVPVTTLGLLHPLADGLRPGIGRRRDDGLPSVAEGRRAGAGAEPGLGGAARRGSGPRRARRSRGPAAPGRLGRGAGAAGGQRRRRRPDRGRPGAPLPAASSRTVLSAIATQIKPLTPRAVMNAISHRARSRPRARWPDRSSSRRAFPTWAPRSSARPRAAGRVRAVDGELAGGHDLGRRAVGSGRRARSPAVRPRGRAPRATSCPPAGWRRTAWRPPTS